MFSHKALFFRRQKYAKCGNVFSFGGKILSPAELADLRRKKSALVCEICGKYFCIFAAEFNTRSNEKNDSVSIGVYIDGVYIPQLSTAGQRNYTVSDSEGKTLITFTREYMARLSHGTHTMTLSYSGYGTLSKTIYIQSVRDAPRTGDIPLTAFTSVSLLSLAAAACCLRKLKKKEHQ